MGIIYKSRNTFVKYIAVYIITFTWKYNAALERNTILKEVQSSESPHTSTQLHTQYITHKDKLIFLIAGNERTKQALRQYHLSVLTDYVASEMILYKAELQKH